MATLTQLCPVKPIALGNNKRLERYDVHRLDEWIELFGSGGEQNAVDWLSTLDGKDDGGSRKRD